jgi:hypothetical protein
MKYLFLALLVLACTATNAQTQVRIPAPSPKEIIEVDLGFTKVSVSYSRILRRNRLIFGEENALFPYDKIWRTGANDGTRVTFNDDVSIKGKTVPKGTYIIYTWPGKFSWDIALYTDLTVYGVPDKYDINKEAIKLTVTPITLSNTIETFTVKPKPTTGSTGVIQIAFEKVLIELPFAKTSEAVSQVITVTSNQFVGLSEIAYRYTSSVDIVKTNTEFTGGQLIVKQAMDLGGINLTPGEYEIFPDASAGSLRVKGNGISGKVALTKTAYEAPLSSAVYGYAIDFYRLAADQKMFWLKFDINNESYLLPVKCDYDNIVMKSIDDAEREGVIDKYLMSAAQYYHDNDKDLSRAMVWIDRAVQLTPRYWYILLKAKIEYKLGWLDKARKTAVIAKDSSAKAQNQDYVRLSEKLVAEIDQDIVAKNKVDKQPPNIMIIQPSDTRGLQVKQDKKIVKVIGKVTDESQLFEVSANGISANVDAEGNFAVDVPLGIGENNILVSATDIKMNKGRYEFVVKRAAANVEVNDIVPVAAKEIIQPGKYYALIIGVQDYIDPAIPDLENPVADAGSLADVLTTQYTFDKANVKLLKNPSRQEVFDAFEALAVKIKPADNLLIFYAGHGNWDEVRKQGYWYPSDAYVKNRASWLSNADLKEYISLMPGKHTLLITDACFAGSILKTRSLNADAPTAIRQLFELPSRKAMTSGALKEVPDKSVFIEYLVKRLKQNPEKYMSAEQLFSSFRTAVINNSANGQVPQFGEIKETGDEGGDFIFMKR